MIYGCSCAFSTAARNWCWEIVCRPHWCKSVVLQKAIELGLTGEDPCFVIQTLCFSGPRHGQKPEHQCVLSLTTALWTALSCTASCGSPSFVPLAHDHWCANHSLFCQQLIANYPLLHGRRTNGPKLVRSVTDTPQFGKVLASILVRISCSPLERKMERHCSAFLK